MLCPNDQLLPSFYHHNMETVSKVLVTGAGPVGLTVALRLAQSGIHVDMIEKNIGLNPTTRAAGYYGATLVALARTGVLDKAVAIGTHSNSLCWRKPLADDDNGGKRLGDIIAKMAFPPIEVGPGQKPLSALLLPQCKLTKLLYDEAILTGRVSVKFGCELIGIEDNGDEIHARVKRVDTGEEETYTASFLVGADGAKSATRKLLDIPFKGHSWPERLVAIDCIFETPPDIAAMPTSFIVHPVHFGIITPLDRFEIGKKSKFRVAAAVDPKDDLSDEELISAEYTKTLMEKMVPGPRPLETEVTHVALYRIHQLCASTFRRGRCVLAGDAAHLNNPFGAMGLSNGLLDADALSDALELIINKGNPLSILDVYSHERLKVFQFFVDPTTTQNKLRCASDPDRITDDWMISALLNDNRTLKKGFAKQFVEQWRTDMRALVG
ncbi:FAD binding domain-containing protein [Colletotrichum truncatum]|uniref:FAD binding domain-containing protein n=1 Tax=Colletotrichum truncatum TaxID=5467 RepID=A0ACC3YU92_COLTU|nr:FAD binding domain-containing protein [Colletotrichum truncatum]KAF6798687.1 FAD binding domain-containing protein [Colletotrichum truncatum]